MQTRVFNEEFNVDEDELKKSEKTKRIDDEILRGEGILDRLLEFEYQYCILLRFGIPAYRKILNCHILMY